MNVYVVNLLLALVWSGYYVAVKYAVNYIHSLTVGFAAYVVAVTYINVVVIKSGKFSDMLQYIRQYPVMLLVACFSFLLNIAFLIGITFSGAINASIILRFDIVFTLILGYIFYKYHLSLWELVGIFCMCIALGLLLSENIIAYRMHLIGDISFVFSALFLAANAFLIRHKLRAVPNVVIAACNITTVMLGFLLFGLVTGHLSDVRSIFQRWDLLFTVLLTGVIVCLIFILYYYCLSRLEVWIVRTILLLVPGFTVVLSYLFLQETLSLTQITGFSVMLAGYLLVVRTQITKTRAGIDT